MSFPGKPTIYNLTLTSSGTEYSYDVPEHTYKLQVKCRTSNALQLAYTSSESGTNYFTIPSDQTYWDDNIHTATTIYLQSGTAAVVAEILTWQGGG